MRCWEGGGWGREIGEGDGDEGGDEEGGDGEGGDGESR